MCNSKASGKGRCFVHSALSKFVTRRTAQVTGASDAMIRETSHLMNQENKHLAPVSGEKATELVQKNMFENEVDETITEHERKIRRSQLRRSGDEVKDGVAGNHFHTWKNLQKRVAARMRKLAWVGLLVPTIALTSCSAGIGTHNAPTHTPATSTSQSPSPTASSGTKDLGAVVPSGTKVTDSKGTYETVKPNESVVQQGFVNAYNSSLQQHGFSQDDERSAQQYVADFMLTQGLDSTALDNGTAGWNAWKENVASKYLAPAYSSTLLNATGNNNDRPSIIFNDPNNRTPALIRDGGPRVKTESLTFTDVEGAAAGSTKYVQVHGNANATYRMTYDAKIAYLQTVNPGKTKAEIEAHYPNTGDVTYSVKGQISYSLIKAGNSWEIAGFNNSFNADFD